MLQTARPVVKCLFCTLKLIRYDVSSFGIIWEASRHSDPLYGSVRTILFSKGFVAKVTCDIGFRWNPLHLSLRRLLVLYQTHFDYYREWSEDIFLLFRELEDQHLLGNIYTEKCFCIFSCCFCTKVVVYHILLLVIFRVLRPHRPLDELPPPKSLRKKTCFSSWRISICIFL